MKNRLNEHDFTKKMIDVIRNNNKSLITEVEKKDGVIIFSKGDPEFEEESKAIKEVDPRAQINDFRLYPADNNAIIDGTLLGGPNDDTGIKFTMSLNQRDYKTEMKNVNMDDEITKMLQVLNGFYKNWYKKWNEKLSEYKNS